MSTSDPDLEARLAELRPPPPREGLRAEVLAAIGAELESTARPSFLDRLLTKRSTWAAAAAVLLALVATTVVANDAQDRRIEALVARPGQAIRPGPDAWRQRDALLARLLGEGGLHD
jgi:hypothetical protein